MDARFKSSWFRELSLVPIVLAYLQWMQTGCCNHANRPALKTAGIAVFRLRVLAIFQFWHMLDL
jgi:hypothetical protein